MHDPALLYAEAQFRRNQGKDDTGLASQIKIGAWSHLGQFADQHYDVNGISLANPLSSGMPALHRGDYGVYGIIDQQLYRPKGGAANSGISVYTRASLSPSDRNLVDTYVDGGIVFNGLVPNRPNDMFGAAFIYAQFSNSVRALDFDQIALGTLATPPRDYEANFEVSYVAQVVPGWTIQPVFTYVAHPSGAGVRYPDAKVTGVRSVMKF
jgi:porin